MPQKDKRRAPARPKVIYKTPGRECVHADKGCCNQCLDPMKNQRIKLRSRTPRDRVIHVNQ